jgi:hypothetical protein
MNIANLVLLGCTVLILMVCYIIALVQSKRGNMVLTMNRWDMSLLLVAPILFVLGWCAGSLLLLKTVQVVLFSFAGICLLGSLIFSIVANKDSVWKVICTVLAKVFLAGLTVCGVLLLLQAFMFILIRMFMGKVAQEDVKVVNYDTFLCQYVGLKLEQ